MPDCERPRVPQYPQQSAMGGYSFDRKAVVKEAAVSDLKSKYDVIVIGAGMGGLTCGSLLAKEGLHVLVAEQGPKPGGCCTSFERAGFTFDFGPAITGGCERGGLIFNTLDKLGLAKEIEFIKPDPVMRVIGSDYDLRISSLGSFAEELKRIFPAESVNIDNFMQECRAVTREFGTLSKAAPDLMSFVQNVGLMMRFLLNFPRVKKYGGKSGREVFVTFFKEPKLRAIFHSIMPFHPESISTLFMATLGSKEEHYYPRGGAQALANVFASGVTKNGGGLALNTMVTKILVEKGKVVGVQLEDGTEIRANHVVSNADSRLTFLKLVGQEHLDAKFVRELNDSKLSGSYLLVSLGVDLDLRAMGFDGAAIVCNRSDNLDEIFSTDLDKCCLQIRMHSLLDPSQAPERMATVQLLSPLPYDYMGSWKREKGGTWGEGYEKLKQEVADRLIAAAEKIIPGLSRHIVCKDIATPLTYERNTLNSQGAAGWFPGPSGKMRSQKTPIKSLYQAGQWTFPGPGVPTVVTSGRNAARLVLKDARRVGGR